MNIEVGGKKIFFKLVGQGKTLVFLHGFLEKLSMWTPIVEELSSNYQCLSIDLYGHGKSDALGSVCTMERMAEAVRAVLNELQLTATYIIGHSMGGYVCLALAELYPEVVKGVCLVNSTTFADSKERISNRKRSISIIKKNKMLYLQTVIPSLFSEAVRLREEKTIKELISSASEMDEEAIIEATEGMMMRKDRSKIFLEGEFRRTMIQGNSDSLILVEVEAKMWNETSVDYVELQGDHMLPYTKYKDISYIIRHFVENK